MKQPGKCNIRTVHQIASASFLFLLIMLCQPLKIFAQHADSVKTGFLLDAAEEYWPKTGSKGLLNSIKHISLRDDKSFLTLGGSAREVYEYFDNYLWGIGPQDKNGYVLNRFLVHADYRYNNHFRLFGELESSFVNGRNGGPRPVQDLNKLATTELFAEYSFKSDTTTRFSLRLGEQPLNYGMGTLLDIRDANVRRSFLGGKFIIRTGKDRIDIFAMKLMKTNPGIFDDGVDPNQRIAGAWYTRNNNAALISKVDAYYLYTDRSPVAFAQGTGREQRHTAGGGTMLTFGNWNLYTEGDIQFGTFNGDQIFAWKWVQTFTYQDRNARFKPLFALQTAMSSGDRNPDDGKLGTFNPIYPKAIYYGFIDNVGSANIALVHLKSGLDLSKKVNLTGEYYGFWRQSVKDGIYGPSGTSLLHSTNDERRVGSMYDLLAGYTFNNRLSLKYIAAYYKRGPFLKDNPVTLHDIYYSGLNFTAKF
jgi:hypothetical protein